MSTKSHNPDLLFGPDVRPTPAYPHSAGAEHAQRAITPPAPLTERLDTLLTSLGISPTAEVPAPEPDALVKVLIAAHEQLDGIAAQLEDRWQLIQTREREVAQREAKCIAHEKRLSAMEALAPVLGKRVEKRRWFR